MRFIYFLILGLTTASIPFSVYSQKKNITDAAMLMKKYNPMFGLDAGQKIVNDAKVFIDLAATNPETIEDLKMHFYRAEVYFALIELATMKAVSDVIPGEGATFAQLLAASPSPFAADAASAAKKSAVTSASSHPVKSDQKSPAYELLKSKLWSKLHTKFRRETQPAVDVELLKVVFDRYA